MVESRHQLFGRWFGFPQCCIDWFETEVMPDPNHAANVPNPLKGTGYRPCPACAQRPVVELIDTINSNRVCPEPFPDFDPYLTKAKAEALLQKLALLTLT
jgi:hypothetical protein